MAATIETSGGAVNGSATSVTRSLTLTSANKLIALIGQGRNPPPGAVSSVTWNGTGMTSIGESHNTTWGQVWAYYLDSPAAGTHDLVVTMTEQQQLVIAGVALTDAETGAPAYGVGAADSGTAVSATVAGSVADDLLLGVTFTDDNTAFSARSGTSIYETNDINGDSNFGAQYATATGSNAQMTWTIVDNPWAAMAIAVGGSGSPPNGGMGVNETYKPQVYQPIMTGFAS